MSYKVNRAYLSAGVLVVVAFAASLLAFPHAPDEVASHWNAAGEADGYMDKAHGLYMLPAVMAGLLLLFTVIPKIDPLGANIEKFRKQYDGFIIVFTVFMLLVHMQMVLWNVGVMVSPNTIMPVGIGLMFFYLGGLMTHTKRNWFVGIRTPWTLSSDAVWEKTHRVGGRLFRACGVIALLGLIVPQYTVWLILGPILASTAYTVIYSFVEYQKEKKTG